MCVNQCKAEGFIVYLFRKEEAGVARRMRAAIQGGRQTNTRGPPCVKGEKITHES